MHASKHSYNFKYEIVLPVCVSVFPRCVTVGLHLFTHARRHVFLPSNINAILRTSQSVHCVVCLCVCVCVCVSVSSMHTQLQFYERVNTRVGSAHVNGSLCVCVCVLSAQGGRDVGNSLCHQVLATCNPIWAARMRSRPPCNTPAPRGSERNLRPTDTSATRGFQVTYTHKHQEGGLSC